MNPIPSTYESTQERHRAPTYTPTMRPSQDIADYLRQYTREKPEVVALWCFGIGFVMGWKLKPW